MQINMQASLFMPQHSRWDQTKTEKMRAHGPARATCRSAKDQERPSGSEDAGRRMEAEDTSERSWDQRESSLRVNHAVQHKIQHKTICLMAWT